MAEQQRTVLLKALGVSPELKAIEALADDTVFDLTANEISDISGLGSAEVEKILNK